MHIRALLWIIPASAVAFNPALVAGEPIRFVQPKATPHPLRFNFASPKADPSHGRNAVTASSPTSVVASPNSNSSSPTAIEPSPTRTVSARTWSSLVTDPPTATPDNARPQPARTLRAEPERDRLDSSSPSGLFSGNVGLAPRGPGSGGPEDTTGSAGSGTEHRAALRSLLPETSGSRNISSSAFGGVDGTFSGSLKQSYSRSAGPGAAGALSRTDRSGLSSNSVPPGASFGSIPGPTAAPDSAGANPPKPTPKPTAPRPVFNPAERPLHSNFELPARPR